MYCNHCGSEIANSDRYCKACGKVVNQAEPTVGENTVSVADMAKKATNYVSRLAIDAKSSMDKKLLLMFIAATLSQLLMLILFFVPIGKYSISVERLFTSHEEAETLSLFTATFDGITWLFYIAPMLVSVVLCVLSIVKYKKNKIYRMIFSKIVTGVNAGSVCLTIITLGISVVAKKSAYIERYGEAIEEYIECSWNITFGGWLNLIVTAASMFLLFMISRQTQQNRA